MEEKKVRKKSNSPKKTSGSAFANLWNKLKNWKWSWVVTNLMLAAFIVLFLVFGSSFFLKTITKHNKEYVVPDFRGMTVAEANAAADKAGLRLDITDSVYSKTNRGKIRSHTPEPGDKVKKGRRVLVTINAYGARKVTMPNLVGYSVRQAMAELNQRGLVLGRINYRSDMATNNVLRQLYKGNVIKPGKDIEAESVIDLVVGLNSSDDKTRVPDVVGRSEHAAIEALHDSYLNVRGIIYDRSVQTYEDSLAAVVYKQNPSASDLSVKMGSDVTIYLKVQDEE